MSFRWFILFLVPLMILAAQAHGGGHQGYTPPGTHSENWVPEPLDVPFIGSDKRAFEAESKDSANQKPMQIIVRPAPEGMKHWADVFIRNQLVLAWKQHKEYHFSFDGLVIIIHADQQDGDAPDHFYVLPPDGYIAIPPDVTLEEGEEIVIEIHPYLLG